MTVTEATEPSKRDPISHLAYLLRDEHEASALSNGDKAALRRLDPLKPDQRHWLPLMRALSLTGLADTFAVRITVNALALSEGRHDGEIGFGAALAQTEVSDLKLGMLLSADLPTLAELGPRLARRLASEGAAANWRQFRKLVETAALSTDDPDHRDIRIRIARDFQRAEATKSKESSK